MAQQHADKWQQYFDPQIAARNRWTGPSRVADEDRPRRPRPRLDRAVGLLLALGMLLAAGATLAAPASADTTTGVPASILGNPGATIPAHVPFAYGYLVGGNPDPVLSVTSGALPPGLEVSGNGIDGTATTPGTYTWTLTAHNGVGEDASVTNTVEVLPAAATIGGNPPHAIVGQMYDYSFTLGGDPLPTTAVTAGALPPGLTLDARGRLSGIPTSAGFFFFDITADTGTGSTAVWSGAMYADPVPPSVDGAPAVGHVGQPYDFRFTVGGAPSPALSIYNGELPPGLTLSQTGELTGTPTQAGFYGFGIAAENDAGRYGFIFGITIQAGTPTVSVADRRIEEGDSGTRRMTFAVTLSAAGSTPVSVHWRTHDGRARAGSDYRAASGMLTFRPGETRKTITVLVNGDRKREATEAFCLLLSGPTGATLGRGHAVGVIRNDD